MRKKRVFLVLFLLVFMSLLFYQSRPLCVFANDGTDLTQELSDNVKEQLENLDFSGLDNILNNLADQFDLFGSSSFKEKVEAIINGDYFADYSNVFSACIGLFWDGFKAFLPYFLIIISISVLSMFVKNIKASSAGGGVNDLIHFVCYAVVVVLLVSAFTQVSSLTLTAVNGMRSQMDVIFPVLLTMLTAMGGVASVGIYKPVVAVLSNGVGFIFANVLTPIFILSFVFVVIGNLSPNIKLGRFVDFFGSLFKWMCGFVLSLFTVFLSLQGISAGRYDGVSIKAAKYAVKSTVPIIGGFVSEGLDFILLSSMLIKNAIGVAGLLLILVTVLSPLISIIVFKLGLQLVSAVLESAGDSRISNFTNKCSKILSLPIVIIVGTAFMYILTIGLMMCTISVV